MSNYFGAYWDGRPLTLGAYIASLRSFMHALQKVHPPFSKVRALGSKQNDEVPIAADLSNLSAVAMDLAWDKEVPISRYSEMGPNGVPTLNSTSRTGYGLVFSNGEEDLMGPDYLYLSVFAGMTSPHISSSVVIRYPEFDESPLSEPALALQVFRLMVDSWNPEFALVASSGFRDLTYSQDDGCSIGWLTYFANPAVSAALPPDVDQRPFGTNGVLITLAPRMPSPEDSDAAVTAVTVAEVLRSHNLMVA